MGRHPNDINQKAFESLCALQATEVEFCNFFGVTDKTLNAWCKRTYKKNFSEVFALKRCTGFVSLRRSQFQLAEKNATMAIFLGKQYLGQTDVVQVTEGVKLNEFKQALEAIAPGKEQVSALFEEEGEQ